MTSTAIRGDGDNGEFSGGDKDDIFDEDMDALKRACLLTGRDPGDIDDSDADSGGGSSETDDLDLLRSIQDRFSIPSSGPKPLNTRAPPSDSDEDDDFETLRAIQRRFSQYERDSLKKKSVKFLHESDLVGTSATSEQEADDNLLESRNGEAPDHGHQYPLDAHAVPEPLGSSNDAGLGNELHSFAEWSRVEDETCNLSVSTFTDSRFPKSAQMFVDALKKNRSCQKFIRNKMIEIEAKIGVNKELKDRIKCLMDFQVACRKRTGRVFCQKKDPRVRLVSLPQSRISGTLKVRPRHPTNFGPTENSHVARYKMVLLRFPISIRKPKWSEIEKERLAKGIKQQYQEMLILKSMESGSGLEGSLGDSNVMSALSMLDFEVTYENIKSFLPMVNWERLASMYFTGRSGAECEARWLNSEDPMINHHPWTILEDKKLLFISQKRGVYNWIDIAVELGTHRTPFQCLVRYQRSLNAFILKRDWAEDDDAQLRAAVETFGEDDWQEVAFHLEGRTGPQCSNRWRKTLHPNRQRVGRWSVDEDKRLKVAIILFGAKNWSKIAQFTPGRTHVQCRERWVNCLDPTLNLEAWTEEEDSKLKAAISEYGYLWSKVATCVPPRTDSQCRRRWKVLLPHEVPLLQASKKMHKTVLISNFVDRERERPLIGPNDFCPLPEISSAGDNGNQNRERRISDETGSNKMERKRNTSENGRSKRKIKGNTGENGRSKREMKGNAVENGSSHRKRKYRGVPKLKDQRDMAPCDDCQPISSKKVNSLREHSTKDGKVKNCSRGKTISKKRKSAEDQEIVVHTGCAVLDVINTGGAAVNENATKGDLVNCHRDKTISNKREKKSSARLLHEGLLAENENITPHPECATLDITVGCGAAAEANSATDCPVKHHGSKTASQKRENSSSKLPPKRSGTPRFKKPLKMPSATADEVLYQSAEALSENNTILNSSRKKKVRKSGRGRHKSTAPLENQEHSVSEVVDTGGASIYGNEQSIEEPFLKTKKTLQRLEILPSPTSEYGTNDTEKATK